VKNFPSYLFVIVILTLTVSCNHSYTPKPRGYFRIDLPSRDYRLYDPENCPYAFEYPNYAKIEKDMEYNTEPCWINISFPGYGAKLHISYKNVNGNLSDFIEDSRALAYKHSIKADAINEKIYARPERHVYGILYDIKGNTASSVQFFVTDSTKHFLRGALYFNVEPNKDSLAPLIDFFRDDVIHMIETFRWKNVSGKK
jgi:gliding motility-associated lipoprotein GldD